MNSNGNINNYTNNNDISVKNLTNNNYIIKFELIEDENKIIENIINVLKKLIKLKQFDPLILDRKSTKKDININRSNYELIKDLNGIQLFYTTNDILFEEVFNEVIFTPTIQSLVIISEIMVNNNLSEPINYYSKEIFNLERANGDIASKRPRDKLMKKAIEEIYLNDLELILEIIEQYKSNKSNLTRFQVDNALYKFMVLAKYYGGKIVLDDLKSKDWKFNEKLEYSLFEKINILRKLQIIGQYSKLFHPFILINFNNNNNQNNNNKLFPLLQYKNIRNIISILTSKDLIMLTNQDYQFYNNINNDIRDTIEILKSVYESLPSTNNSNNITWDEISRDTFFINEEQIKVFNGLKQFENLFPIATNISNKTKMNIKEAIKLPKLNQIFQMNQNNNSINNQERMEYDEYKKKLKQISNENPNDLLEIVNKKKQLKDKIIYGYLLNNHIQHLSDICNNSNNNNNNNSISKSTNKFSKKYKQFIKDNQLNNNNNNEYNWESEPTSLELLFHNNHSINIKSLQDKYKYRLNKLNNIQELIELLKQFTNIKTSIQLIIYRRSLSNILNECERQIYNNWPNKFIQNYQKKYQIKSFNMPLFENEQDLDQFFKNYLINSKQIIESEINYLKINFIEELNIKGSILNQLNQLNQSINENWFNLYQLRKNITLIQKKVQLTDKSEWLDDGIDEIKSIIKQEEDLNCIEFLIYLCFESIVDEIEYYQELKQFSNSIKTLKSFYSHSSLKFSSVLFPLDKLKPLGVSQSNRNSKSINILLQLNYLIEPIIIILKNKIN